MKPTACIQTTKLGYLNLRTLGGGKWLCHNFSNQYVDAEPSAGVRQWHMRKALRVILP